jgi:hypothetical protein
MDGGSMKATILGIKSTWKRRLLLCMAIFPAVLMYVVIDEIERMYYIALYIVETFKEEWKGE